MKKIIYILSFLMLALTVRVSAQNELTTYLETAAENNPGLKVKFNEYMAALEKVPQVGALPDPTFAFGYFIQPVETRVGPQQAKISASQMFPWFGTLSSRENSVEAMAKAKYEVFEEAKSKLFYDVKSTYYNLFFMHQAIDITIENIDILASFKGLANIKVESGSASAVDAYRVQMEINDLENQLALLKDNAQVLSVKFNSFLNVDVNSNIQMGEKLTGVELLDKHLALDSVLMNNNTLAAFDYQIEDLQYRQKVASKEGLPQFNIGFDYTFIGEGNSTASNAGQDAFMFPKVGITIPLYRNKYKAKVQEVIYLQEAKTNEKTDKENSITVLFEIVWKDYQDALRRTVLYEEQEELAEKSLSILESEYATSNLNFEEILRMERKLLKYALEMQKATADKEAAVAFIQYLQGQ
ncbi:TolC family protein [Carboxylicivirga sp. A043]|uniref:TolC family protein n=1 Tax=Carboxylicivirga litoralis TaxID=2816963 RepID=UPI0021CB0BB1|nr:TolC family protein [Carboxylicivirga sp. A043]MCU4158302.1 TolC family protein [Carboxylicivirga sp. A043]